MKDIDSRRLIKALKEAGYEKVRDTKGSHSIYSNGKQSVSVPLVNLNFKIATKITKQCGLKNLI